MGIFIVGASLGLLALTTLIFYRLYLSPLAHVPGPKLAALTTCYNAYYDLIQGGQFVWRVEEMHEQYGPIVRIRPDVIHVSSPEFIEKLFTGSPKQRREKFFKISRGLQAPGSMLATEGHHLHQRRRAALNPYFSNQNITHLQPVIQDTVRNLFRRMDAWADGSPVEMRRVFRAATKDVIQSYALGGDSERCLDMEDCNASFFDVIVPGRICYLGTHVYPLAKMMASLPPALMTKLAPYVGVFATFMQNLNKKIDGIKTADSIPEKTSIFHEILRNPDLPPSEKKTRRLADEAMVLLIAGSETTASTIGAIIYHLLADKAAFARLKAELREVMRDSNDPVPELSRLSKLPYLNAVIEEAIRLYPGATARQDRIAPNEDLVYTNPVSGAAFRIPKGTVVGMTPTISNRDRRVWGEDADEFKPERFLVNPHLRSYVLSFSKGTRQCLGINLAYAELRIFIAAIFHRYEMFDPTEKHSGPTLELFETQRRDVAMMADYVTPALPRDSKGLRLLIRT